MKNPLLCIPADLPGHLLGSRIISLFLVDDIPQFPGMELHTALTGAASQQQG